MVVVDVTLGNSDAIRARSDNLRIERERHDRRAAVVVFPIEIGIGHLLAGGGVDYLNRLIIFYGFAASGIGEANYGERFYFAIILGADGEIVERVLRRSRARHGVGERKLRVVGGGGVVHGIVVVPDYLIVVNQAFGNGDAIRTGGSDSGIERKGDDS